MSDSPPPSPQRSQHAAHQLERSRREMHSPEGRRTPTAPPLSDQQYHQLRADLAARFAALPPLSEPSTRRRGRSRHVDGQQTPVAPPLPNQPQHLSSAELAARLAALPPHPLPHRLRRSAAPPSVSCDS
jgi:hypothetical protein